MNTLKYTPPVVGILFCCGFLLDGFVHIIQDSLDLFLVLGQSAAPVNLP